MKKLLLVLLFVPLINSCSKSDDDSITADELKTYQVDLISYFKSIALGFEFGGVSEITRLGMKENEMQEIATFMKQIIIDKKDPKKILPKVKSWRKEYQKVKYCFDNKLGAYEYVKLR